ncbi:MAG TPA: HIT family protein [Flavobacteriales bacterium]|jgi:histidine triad (HIT) family protein|nr:HIT family protein [Flavobacteriales bacterium]MBK6551242.1 HIT family protein [Flavobacteriales bacterium]MBK7102066.1 HIT family protein [Flavobacteriales bacterium]MBK7114417.1 HIT family protein [Flavobacteriales bacterium]MBK7483523.1 HIT family protein [Flavobacteriales bacterium]
MASIFTRIIQGEIPCYKLAESADYISFLDVSPLREGHALVVPKLEVDHLFDLEGAELTGILPFAKEVARKIKAVVPCTRIGISVVGLEVPHAHIHLIPIDRMSDMDFTRTRATFTPSEFEALAERIRQA